MEAEWLEALQRLRQRVGERNYATWIEPIRCCREAEGFRLEVSSPFFQAWVTRHFLGVIREVLSINGAAPEVRVVATGGVAMPPAETDVPLRAKGNLPRKPKIGRLVPDYSFETFVVGVANEEAFQAARSVTQAPGRRFNPFFVWGGVGLGKTHLINALAHDLLKHSRRCRLACLSAEAFMNTMIMSLRQDQMAAFRERFRELDVLILDDVQFLAGKERTQEEFFHTFNALHSTGGQIVLTSDKPPAAIAELEQRLRSRFEGGLIADIRPPTYAMRVAIVMKKAALQGIDVPENVAAIVAERSGPTVRELEGALTRVLASAALRGVTLDVKMVEAILEPVNHPNVGVSVEVIQETVSAHFRLSIADLKSHRRDRALAYARQVAMYLSRTLADASFPSIAEKFGGRDHSTVMYAVRVMEQKRHQDPGTVRLLDTLEGELRNRPQL